MTHIFDPKNKNKLDNEQRRKSLPPKETMEKFKASRGEFIGDVGCGIGYFTIPASELVGTEGKVFAIDISDEMLKELNKRIEENNIKNIETIKTEYIDEVIEDSELDMVFLSNIFHEVENKKEFLDSYVSKLKTKGRLGFIEWKKEHMDIGPPYEHRVELNEIKDILAQYNFKCVTELDLNETHYGVILSRE